MFMSKAGGVLACLAALLTTAPVSARRPAATRPSNGPTLWQGLRFGMTPAQVRALHTARNVALSDACSARVVSVYERGRLVRVALNSRPSDRVGAECGVIIEKSLALKYGPATSDGLRLLYGGASEDGDSAPLHALVADKDLDRYTIESWCAPDRLVLFKARQNKAAWSVTYLARPTGSVEAVARL